MNFNPENPQWPNRDRFVLSNGHGSMLIYSCLYLTGYKNISLEDIKKFRQLKSPTAGHPEYGDISGIETTTGPLSQGLGNAVGFALAEQILQSNLGKNIINHHTYVFAGDGCLMEGLSHEAASLAGHLNLSKLIVFFDDNSISIDGSTNLSISEDTIKRYIAYGWDTISIDGHNYREISNAIDQAKNNTKPTLIASYPLFSLVMTSNILPFSTNNTVTGIDIPESKNSLVIPIFFPISPILIFNFL